MDQTNTSADAQSPKKRGVGLISKDGVSYLIPFILVTFCFALWGFANDITNPMVKAFSKIFRMSVTRINGIRKLTPSLEIRELFFSICYL